MTGQPNMKLLVTVLLAITQVECATQNDTKTLLADLLTDYDTNVRPVENQTEPVNVYLHMLIKSIQEFDEVKGMFAFVGGMYVTWTDSSMKWDPAQYGGLTEVTVHSKRVWVPNLALSTPSDEMQSPGQDWNTVRYYHDGRVSRFIADLIKSTCSVNVQYYPFDTQRCVTSFNALGYYKWEVMINALAEKVDVSIYQSNPLWDMVDSGVDTSEVGGSTQIDFTFWIKRKSSYVMLNAIIPIVCLSVINVIVFILPSESGERVGFSITVLLSIAVFMTIVADTLPKTSEPVPVISYKLIIDMVSSSLITFIAVLNVRLYNKKDQEAVPACLKRIYTVCFIGKRNSVKSEQENDMFVADEAMQVTATEVMKKPFRNISPSRDQDKRTTKNAFMTESLVTWKMISHMFDIMAFSFFLCVFITNSVVFMTLTSIQA